MVITKRILYCNGYSNQWGAGEGHQAKADQSSEVASDWIIQTNGHNCV
jgi:hypothetical protein